MKKEVKANDDWSITVYRRLVYDKRISKGAFRLWHYLRDRKNASGKTWPQQREIARDLGCKTHSLPGWISELVQAGYLATEKKGQNHHLEYTILYGDGKGDMPKWATRNLTNPMSRSPIEPLATPNGATPRAAPTGYESNNLNVIPQDKGEISPPVFEPVKRGQYRREYEAQLSDANADLKAAQSDRSHLHRVLKKNVIDFCNSLREEAAAKPDKHAELMGRVTAQENNAQNYRYDLTEQGKAVVSAWENRIKEIRLVMSGIKT